LAHTGLVPDAYAFLGEVFGFMYSFLALLYGICLIGLRYTDPDMPRPFRLGKSGNAVAWAMALLAVLVYGFAAFGCSHLIHQLSGFLLLSAGISIYAFYRFRRGVSE
jgi:amino acid transporter